jgi:signal transduction histidine kinase
MVANGQACLRWLSADPPNVTNGTSAVERIVRDGKDAREIIKGLRTLFKRSSPQKTPLNLREIVDEVVFLTRSRVVREGVVMNVEIPDNLPRIMGDPIQLQQILLNLVSNGIEAMHVNLDRPKNLIIRSQQRDEVVLTEVVDNGEGIPDPEQIFETFFTTKENGMGIGLPICKSIIEAHGGRMWASNGVPAGSVVSFAIPIPELPGADS